MTDLNSIQRLFALIFTFAFAVNTHAVSLSNILGLAKSNVSDSGARALMQLGRVANPSSPLVYVRHDVVGSFKSIDEFVPSNGFTLNGTVKGATLSDDTGLVIRYDYKVPGSTIKPSSTRLVEVDNSKIVGVERTFDTLNGPVREVKTYNVISEDLNWFKIPKDVGSSNIRLQKGQRIITENMELIASLNHMSSYSQIKTNIKTKVNGKEVVHNGLLKIPSQEGFVMGYNFSSNGTRLTVHTSTGQEIHYAVTSPKSILPSGENGQPLEIKVISRSQLSLAEMREYAATRVVYPGRAQAEAPARGIQVELQNVDGTK